MQKKNCNIVFRQKKHKNAQSSLQKENACYTSYLLGTVINFFSETWEVWDSTASDPGHWTVDTRNRACNSFSEAQAQEYHSSLQAGTWCHVQEVIFKLLGKSPNTRL